MTSVFADRIAAIKQIKDDEFADLYFGSDASETAMQLDLDGRMVQVLRLSLTADEVLNLGSIRIYVTGKDTPLRLTGSANVKQSSNFYKDADTSERGLHNFLEGHAAGASIHTRKEKSPWVEIDLGESYQIARIILNNRDDDWAARAWTLLVETAEDDRQFTQIYSHSQREAEFALRVEQKMAGFGSWPEPDLPALRCLDMVTLAVLRGDYAAAKNILATKDKEIASQPVEAIKHAVTQDLLYARERFWTTHGILRSFAFWSHEEKLNYIRDSCAVLNIVRDVTENACFGFGSALACHRDGDLIPHDDDLDIIVAFPKSEIPTVPHGLKHLEKALTQRGLEVFGDYKSHLKVREKGKKEVDVFVGLIEPEMTVSWFPGPPEGLPVGDVFPPRQAELLGEPFAIPKNTETYLAGVYGADWHMPKARWRHDWSAKRHKNLE